MATYLKSSGSLAMSEINGLFARGNNLNAYRGTQYYTSAGGPYNFPTGQIGFNNFYGTGFEPNLSNAIVTAYMQSNRYKFFQNCFAQNTTDLYSTNSYYTRYTTSSSFTRSVDLTGTGQPTSASTTVITAQAAGAAYTSFNPSIQLNGSAQTATLQVGAGEASIYRNVYSLNYSSATSIYDYWTHNSGNYGSWAAMLLIPGNWGSYATYTMTSQASANDYTMPPYSIAVYSYHASYNASLSTLTSVVSGSCVRVAMDAWWYNHGHIAAFINYGSGNATIRCFHGYPDGYGGTTHSVN